MKSHARSLVRPQEAQRLGGVAIAIEVERPGLRLLPVYRTTDEFPSSGWSQTTRVVEQWCHWAENFDDAKDKNTARGMFGKR